MYQVDATARAPEGLTLNNPAQARKGAVWGHATRVLACVPEARALNPSVFEEFKSASLRDAVAHVLTYPTLRFKRGCSLRSRTRTIVGLLPSVATHACAGLLKVSAFGTCCQKRTYPRKSSLTRGQTRCCTRNTAWTRTKLPLSRA